ncbi:glycosyltransferase [Streptococcus suis]|uniref:glycosyltransferase n=1 Tax=Streptococcus suis TaxID=1307 RepID=UPI000C198B3C|nr:glycosyltransferase [Streptococcus suis]
MHNSNPIHIAFSVAGKYADYLGTTIYSILKHNSDNTIHFYILHQEIETEYRQNLEKLLLHFPNATIRFLKIENNYFNQIKPAKDGLHVSTYYRFLLTELLPELDKVLYLDVDVLVRGNIKPLWDTDISSVSLGVSREIDIYAGAPEHVTSIGLEDHHNYFNAGVILFNLNKLRVGQLDKVLLETAVAKSPDLRFGDQDILNMIFKDDTTLFSYIYNFTNWRLMWPEISDQPGIILHFSGSGKTKPWNNKHQTFDYLGPYIDEYRKYRLEYYHLIASDKAKVAVVVELHDREEHLKECIDSIIRQSYTNLDILLLDDQANEHCRKIAQEYCTIDQRISFTAPHSVTRAERYQTIAEKTAANYILFVRESDILEEDCIKYLVEKAEQGNTDLVLSNYFVFDSNDGVFYFHEPIKNGGVLLKQDLESPSNKQQNYLEHLWGKLFTTEYFLENIPSYSGNLLLSDFYAAPSLAYLPRADYIYREDKTEKISVIVTAYNVAPYIEECVTSIQNQTYPNLEIILVNDGSTDETAKICDKLASQDNRIKIIHKENGGASDAKNVGVKHSNGEYITLVDGDDVIDKELVATLYHHVKQEQADIAMGHYYRYDENDGKFYYFHIDAQTNFEVITPTQAVIRQTNWGKYNNANYIITVCKLIKKSCFQGVKFPFGRKFDDDATTHKLFIKANKIVQINKNLYMYRRRKNSIMTSGFQLSWVDDFIPIYEEKIADCLLAQIPLKDIRLRYINILRDYKQYLEYQQLTDTKQYELVLQKLQFAKLEQTDSE